MSDKHRYLNPLPAALAILSIFAFSVPANAHHAFAAEFDANQPIEVKGTITKFELVNPHSWLYLDVKTADGKTENWGFEFGAPFSLKQKGLTKKGLAVGTEITVKGYKAKNGQNFGYATNALLPDGRRIETGGAQDAPA